MPSTEELNAFVRLLAGQATAQAQTVTENVDLAMRDPAAYVAQFADDLSERYSEATDLLEDSDKVQTALVHELEKAGLVAEVDWKSETEDIVWNVNNVLEQQGRPPVDELAADETEDVPAVLTRLNGALQPRGLTLLQLYLDSDSYTLVVADTSDVLRLHQLAEALQFRFEKW